MDPLVSVWMIVFNHDKYIRQALDSVLSQKVDFSFEIVIGEDCSNDKSREVLIEYQQKHPDLIQLILHPENVGMIANQNATFQKCKGQYIAMLEGDDYWLDDRKLATQVAELQKLPSVDLCFHPAISSKTGRKLSYYGNQKRIIPLEKVILGGGYFCPTPSLLFRRSVVEKLPIFLNYAPAGDYYIQIFGAISGGALYIPQTMSVYRVDAEGSWSLSVKNFESKQIFRRKTIVALRRMDRHLNGIATKAFKKKIGLTLLVIAFGYLTRENQIQYTRFINRAGRSHFTPKVAYMVVKFLEKHPVFLKTANFFVKQIRILM